MLYTIKEVTKLFPRCTTYMISNYRWKHKIGTNYNGRVYFTEDEVEQFIFDVEKENMDMRKELYEFIKTHPGLKENNLYNHLGKKFTKHRTANLLADITQQVDEFPGLYENDEDCLFVEGYEINLNKKYDKNNGIFY